MTSPNPETARTDVLEIIGQSVFHAMGLLESLEEETSALESQDPEALMLAVDAKQASVDALRKLEDRRLNLCRAAGFDNGPFQMEELAAWCDEDRAILDRWDHLMEVAADCNARNLTNGAIVRTRQQHIETSLTVLRGDDTETHTYHRDGTSNERQQHALAKA